MVKIKCALTQRTFWHRPYARPSHPSLFFFSCFLFFFFLFSFFLFLAPVNVWEIHAKREFTIEWKQIEKGLHICNDFLSDFKINLSFLSFYPLRRPLGIVSPWPQLRGLRFCLWGKVEWKHSRMGFGAHGVYLQVNHAHIDITQTAHDALWTKEQIVKNLYNQILNKTKSELDQQHIIQKNVPQ